MNESPQKAPSGEPTTPQEAYEQYPRLRQEDVKDLADEVVLLLDQYYTENPNTRVRNDARAAVSTRAQLIRAREANPVAPVPEQVEPTEVAPGNVIADLQTKESGDIEFAQNTIDLRSSKLAAAGLLAFHPKLRKEAGIGEEKVDSAAVHGLLSGTRFRQVTIAEMKELPGTIDDVGSAPLAQKLGIEGRQLNALLFFRKVLDERYENFAKVYKKLHPDKDPQQVTMQEFLDQTKRLSGFFIRFSESLKGQMSSWKDLDPETLSYALSEAFRLDNADSNQQFEMQDKFNGFLPELGLKTASSEDFLRFYSLCRDGNISMDQMANFRPEYFYSFKEAQRVQADECKVVINKMKTHIMENAMDYIALYTHNGEMPGKKRYEEVLRERLTSSDLKVRDVVELYSALRSAEGTEHGKKLPENLNNASPEGALLLQMKVLQMISEQDRTHGNGFKGFLFREVISETPNLNLPPEAVEVFQQMANKTLDAAGQLTVFSGKFWVRKWNDVSESASGGLGVEKETVDDVAFWTMATLLTSYVGARLVEGLLLRPNQIGEQARTLGQRYAELDNPTWVRRHILQRVPLVGQVDKARMEMAKRQLRMLYEDIEQTLGIAHGKLKGGHFDALIKAQGIAKSGGNYESAVKALTDGGFTPKQANQVLQRSDLFNKEIADGARAAASAVEQEEQTAKAQEREEMRRMIREELQNAQSENQETQQPKAEEEVQKPRRRTFRPELRQQATEVLTQEDITLFREGQLADIQGVATKLGIELEADGTAKTAAELKAEIEIAIKK